MMYESNVDGRWMVERKNKEVEDLKEEEENKRRRQGSEGCPEFKIRGLSPCPAKCCLTWQLRRALVATLYDVGSLGAL